jgi:hypothetical protein
MKAKNRILLCAVIAAFCGCRKSSPPAEQAKPSAAVTPAPSQNQSQVESVSAAHQETSDELLSRRATKTFQVVTPAAFSADQVPANEISEFLVPGHAGELLRVEVKLDQGRGPEPLLAARMAGDSAALKAADPDFCRDEQSYPLLQDGTVHVVYDPNGHKDSLRFTLVKKDDPMLSVGLTADQVSIHYGNIGERQDAKAGPYLHSCEVGSSSPAYVVVQSHAGWLYIMQVQGYKNVFFDDPSMQVLISSLERKTPPQDANKLPFAGDDDAAIVMTARPEWMEGRGWKGWRWIEGSSQDGDYPGDIGYTFEGVTNDGRFFLRMRGSLSHPELKRLDTQDILDETARDKADKEHNQLLKKSLEKAEPGSFTPNLNDIDAMIRSIRIQQ